MSKINEVACHMLTISYYMLWDKYTFHIGTEVALGESVKDNQMEIAMGTTRTWVVYIHKSLATMVYLYHN